MVCSLRLVQGCGFRSLRTQRLSGRCLLSDLSYFMVHSALMILLFVQVIQAIRRCLAEEMRCFRPYLHCRVRLHLSTTGVRYAYLYKFCCSGGVPMVASNDYGHVHSNVRVTLPEACAHCEYLHGWMRGVFNYLQLRSRWGSRCQLTALWRPEACGPPLALR